MISFPADKVNLENLQKLLESKSDLIKKALEVEAFPIEEHDDQDSAFLGGLACQTSMPSLPTLHSFLPFAG